MRTTVTPTRRIKTADYYVTPVCGQTYTLTNKHIVIQI